MRQYQTDWTKVLVWNGILILGCAFWDGVVTLIWRVI